MFLRVYIYELWKFFFILNFLKGINIDLEEGMSFFIIGIGFFMVLIYVVYKGYIFDILNNVY